MIMNLYKVISTSSLKSGWYKEFIVAKESGSLRLNNTGDKAIIKLKTEFQDLGNIPQKFKADFGLKGDWSTHSLIREILKQVEWGGSETPLPNQKK